MSLDVYLGIDVGSVTTKLALVDEKGKKLSRIITIILKLLNKVSIIFTKLNKQLQIKFIDKKVTNYNKHATKKMKSRTKVISNSLGIKDNSKERLNSKYQVIKNKILSYILHELNLLLK